jgi:signal transduction histidine kinase
MLTAGAMGFVVKGGSIDELVGAIRRASTGTAELDQRVLPAAVEDLRRLLEEERERHEQIERLSRAREEFVQVLSHELRTPLTVILGALRMLGNRGEGEETSFVESAIRRAGELEFLVEGLELIASSPSSESAALPRQAVAGAAARLGEEPDTLRVEDGAWDGVPHRFVERVAFELLSNAARHGGRPIEVSAFQSGKDATLIVSDSGNWAPPAQDFAPFYQEDMTVTRAQSGFGLGLFMASRLCQACEGGLTVRPEEGRTVAEATFRLK